jgi:hypothetical protein
VRQICSERTSRTHCLQQRGNDVAKMNLDPISRFVFGSFDRRQKGPLGDQDIRVQHYDAVQFTGEVQKPFRKGHIWSLFQHAS